MTGPTKPKNPGSNWQKTYLTSVLIQSTTHLPLPTTQPSTTPYHEVNGWLDVVLRRLLEAPFDVFPSRNQDIMHHEEKFSFDQVYSLILFPDGSPVVSRPSKSMHRPTSFVVCLHPLAYALLCAGTSLRTPLRAHPHPGDQDVATVELQAHHRSVLGGRYSTSISVSAGLRSP